MRDATTWHDVAGDTPAPGQRDIAAMAARLGDSSGPEGDPSSEDPARSDSTPAPLTKASSTDRMSQVSRALRATGAIFVVGAMAAFLMQQWIEGTETLRYLMLLGVSGVLTASGALCGLGVRESRSARTFLSLVVATLPAHAAILGTMLHGHFAFDGRPLSTGLWSTVSMPTALALSGGALAALSVMLGLASRALARPHAGFMTLSLMAMQLPVLLPLRQPNLVGLVVAATAIGAVILQHKAAELGYAMRTPEGKFLRGMLFVTPILITVRTLFFHEPTLFFIGTLFLVGPITLHEWLQREARRVEGILWAQWALGLLAMIGALFMYSSFASAVHLPASFWLPCAGIATSVVAFALSLRCAGSGFTYQRVGALALTLPAIVNFLGEMVLNDAATAGIVCMAIGLVTATVGVFAQRLLPVILGSTATLLSLGYFLVRVVDVEGMVHWGSLVTVGVALIFTAALCERYSRQILGGARRLHERVAAWDY